ncbi:MAG: cob(I)yrinic acid a,c-diamide adenosyltransferase [Saprospiraceae bacterium]|nr:cob(I)yrinic acid a,c-diamide adenosyltransferase [Saprospiraceae bacterium]
MAFKIYTKTGDEGETSLFGGKRLLKNNIRIEAYGTVDELNAFVGLVRDMLTDDASRSTLKAIQDILFTIGANLASDPEKSMPTPDIRTEDVLALEQAIDSMEHQLPTLKNFILPGGHPLVSYCHLARCVCRRAERQVIALNEAQPVESILLQYLNRLSDYFFVLGRYQGQLLKVEEVVWKPRS